MNRIKNTAARLIIIFFWSTLSSFTLPDKAPDISNEALFSIARSKDANVVWYTLNTNKNGVLNLKEPIKVFWIKPNEGNKNEPLTWIQNKYAYGIKVLSSEPKDNEVCHFQFVSYARKTFALRRTADNAYKVFTTTDNKEIEVTQIFVQMDGGSFWVPTISYVTLQGIEPQTGSLKTETIIP